MKKNDIYEIHIDDLTVEGNGIGRIDNMAVFAAGMLPGETGRVRIIKLAKRYAVARLEELLISSPLRQEPACGVYKRCGGCSLMHMSYFGQLSAKRKRVTDCIRRIAMSDAPVNEVVPCESAFRYRNKTSFPVREQDGEVRIGCYERRSHKVVDVDDCLISSEKCARIISRIRKFIREYGISAYNEDTKKGIIKHIVIRESSLGQVMTAIVINAKTMPHEKELAERLKDIVDAVAVNINMSEGNCILSPQTRIIWGEDHIVEAICGLKFEVSINSFMQINHEQTEKLYSLAISRADICENDVVADLYCGAGTISLCAAKKAKKVYGIEIVPQAVENAKKNAKKNGIENAEFLCADCAEGFNEIIKKSGRPDVIIVDPPRKGLDEKVIRDIAAVGTDRLVYVSCDPATLARDAAVFETLGYRLKEVTPVDMFPNTVSVEDVVLFLRG